MDDDDDDNEIYIALYSSSLYKDIHIIIEIFPIIMKRKSNQTENEITS